MSGAQTILCFRMGTENRYTHSQRGLKHLSLHPCDAHAAGGNGEGLAQVLP